LTKEIKVAKSFDDGAVAGLLANKPIRKQPIYYRVVTHTVLGTICSFAHIYNKAPFNESDEYGKCDKCVVTKTRTIKEKTRITMLAERQTNETEITGKK